MLRSTNQQLLSYCFSSDYDLSPMTMTFDLDINSVKVTSKPNNCVKSHLLVMYGCINKRTEVIALLGQSRWSV